MINKPSQPWQPDSNETVSGKPGAVHLAQRAIRQMRERITHNFSLTPLDVDDVQASIITFSMSRDFALADLGCKDMPILKDVTITPGVTFTLDHRFYDKAGVGGASGRATTAAGVSNSRIVISPASRWANSRARKRIVASFAISDG